MEAVKEAILDDFDKWLNETGGNYKEQLDDFMAEMYARKVEDRNIFEQIKAMNSPPSADSQECKGCSAGLQTLAACSERNGQHGSRKKRSSGGKGHICKLILMIFWKFSKLRVLGIIFNPNSDIADFRPVSPTAQCDVGQFEFLVNPSVHLRAV